MAINNTVLVFNLTDPTRSHELASRLRRDPEVRQAIVVERTLAGDLLVVDDDIARDAGAPALVGGTLGALVGILGGPVGVLLGLSVGSLGGLVVDAVTSEDDVDGLSLLATEILPGTNVLFAEIKNESFPAESWAEEFGGFVIRLPGDVVTAEVNFARAAADDAAKEARKARHAQHSTAFKASVSRLFHHDGATVV